MYESLMELMEPQLILRDKTKIEEGMQQGQKITAIRMLNSGKYTLDEIANISGLSLKEIKLLKEIWINKKEMAEDKSMHEALMELIEPRLVLRDEELRKEGMVKGIQGT